MQSQKQSVSIVSRRKGKCRREGKHGLLDGTHTASSRVFSDGDPLVVAMRNPPTVGVDRTLKIFVSHPLTCHSRAWRGKMVGLMSHSQVVISHRLEQSEVHL